MPIKITPPGRIVQGHPMIVHDKDRDGKPLLNRQQQPKTQCFFALAIPKTDPGVGGLIADLKAIATAAFPQLFAAGEPARFSYKFADGDDATPNTEGISPCNLEGFAGHWVFKFNSTVATPCYQRGGEPRIHGASEIKKGDYVRVAYSAVGNSPSPQAGIYLNPDMVEFVRVGDPIGREVLPDATAVFGDGRDFRRGPAAAPVAPVAPSAPVAPAQAPKRLVEGVAYAETDLRASGWTPAAIAALSPERI